MQGAILSIIGFTLIYLSLSYPCFFMKCDIVYKDFNRLKEQSLLLLFVDQWHIVYLSLNGVTSISNKIVVLSFFFANMIVVDKWICIWISITFLSIGQLDIGLFYYTGFIIAFSYTLTLGTVIKQGVREGTMDRIFNF